MIPERPLPFPDGHEDVDSYVNELLEFVSSNEILNTLCGGVHILDFITSEPDLYGRVLPADWREWIEQIDVYELLDLVLKENCELFLKQTKDGQDPGLWRDKPWPPVSLLEYVCSIRRLNLDRRIKTSSNVTEGEANSLSRQFSVGMKPKKAHEVVNFANFIDTLCSDIASSSPYSITRLIDFGSGQNYLGRVLASPRYRREVVAVESKHHNIDGAIAMDVSAKMAKKKSVWRNKKEFRATGADTTTQPEIRDKSLEESKLTEELAKPVNTTEFGRIHYVEHQIEDGNLVQVLEKVDGRNQSHEETTKEPAKPQYMVISLHSCGNLLHHGLRSLIMNDSVKAVAMVGCCYNLLTERLGPPSTKIPSLRPPNNRLERTSSACDPHGFPMSQRLANYEHGKGKGVRINITARMMAVQAPENWTRAECESFFTKHFFRALFQRILLDRGFIRKLDASDDFQSCSPAGVSATNPIVIGRLSKSSFTSFNSYVRSAIKRLSEDPDQAEGVKKYLSNIEDEDIAWYEEQYQHKRHHLAVLWSLMAFSATLIEATIIADRWLFLKEQENIQKCWAQNVFNYRLSPRNIALIAIKT